MSAEASVADAISAFPSNVSPSDQDQLVLTRGELNRIIANAMKELREEIEILKIRQDEDFEHHARDMLDHGQRLKRLEVVELLPAQIDRAEVLRAILARNGGKMLAKDVRKRMRVDKSTFSRLLAKMRNEIEVRPFHTDKRNYLLVLRSENG